MQKKTSNLHKKKINVKKTEEEKIVKMTKEI